jgi:hypothetical protein
MTALVILLALAAPAADSSPPDVIVVAADDMLPALKPWFAHRQRQGHVIGTLPNTLSQED